MYQSEDILRQEPPKGSVLSAEDWKVHRQLHVQCT